MTEMLWPDFCDLATWRDVSRNNQPVGRIGFLFLTDQTWLPQALSEAGFFKSNNEVKKNRPDLWRDTFDGDTFRVGFANIRMVVQ